MRKRFSALFILLMLVVPCFSQEYKKPLDKLELANDDTLVFLGDSITHQCLYTQYVEDYFYTRYPRVRIRFHNAGVGGDKAADALVRFDEDVAKFKPKYVTVLLGMNDGCYTHFDPQIFSTYEQGMNKLMDMIGAVGARAVLIGPTMFDTRAVQLNPKMEASQPRDNYYNAVLAFYGAWLREQVYVRGLGFVDMYGSLNRLTLEQRKTDPKFTMIADAIHPGPAGQIVMALAILEGINAAGSVSEIHIYRDEYSEWQIECTGGDLYNEYENSSDGGFTFLAESLPWVVPAEAQVGYKLIQAGPRMSREWLRINGLESGNYELRIDGKSIGTYSDVQLSSKLELQENPKTPQYQQALQVAMLNKERNDKAVHPLRNLWRELKTKRRAARDDPAKLEQFQQWQKEFPDKVAKLLILVQEYEKKIYRLNQPQPHNYEIVYVN